jgi:hypothetical protein
MGGPGQSFWVGLAYLVWITSFHHALLVPSRQLSHRAFRCVPWLAASLFRRRCRCSDQIRVWQSSSGCATITTSRNLARLKSTKGLHALPTLRRPQRARKIASDMDNVGVLLLLYEGTVPRRSEANVRSGYFLRLRNR